MRRINYFLGLLCFVLCLAVGCDNSNPIEKYIIEFMLGDTVYQSVNVDSDKNIVLPQPPQQEGKAFKGWFFSLDGEEELDLDYFINNKDTKTLRVYAKFVDANTVYSITYNIDGGVNSIQNPNTFTPDDIISLQGAEKTGYTFVGWFDNEGNRVDIIQKGTIGNLTLYARYSLANYTINYKLNGGVDAGNLTTYTIETPTIILRDSSKLGYTFEGWFDAEENKVEKIEQGSIGDKVLTARFSPTEYTITYNLNGGTNTPSNPTTYTIETPNIALKEASKKGYEFIGWFDSDENNIVTIQQGSIGNKVLTAKFSAIHYSIEYKTQGGLEDKNPITYTIESETFVLLEARKSGYQFVGWFDSFGGGNRVSQIAKGTTGNIILYARFSLVNYTITYHTDGGSLPNNPTTYTIENPTIILENSVKSGYGFKGWYDNALFEGKAITEITAGHIGNLDLYAKFTLGEYSITYYLNGGINSPSNPMTYTIETPTITLKNATKKGYTFDGWYNNKSFTGNKITQIISESMGDLILYAKFIPVEYNITYYYNDGVNPGNPTTYTVETKTIVLKPTSKPGYRFEGWFDRIDGGNMVTEIILGSIGHKTLHARFSIITYTITYELQGGTNASQNPTTYTVKTSTITLQNANKKGYTFEGWYDSSLGGNKVEQIKQGSVSDKTLYARYSLANYTINYELNGGTNNPQNPVTYTINTPIITLYDTYKRGYMFEGWFDEQGYKIEQIEQGSTGDRTITAQFSLITYAIAYNLNGGTQVNNPLTYTIESQTIVLKGTTKIGYTFEGWYDSVDGGNKVEQVEQGSVGNIVLYAKFTPIVYSITYNGVDGLENNNPIRYTIDEPTILLKEISKAGHIFEGWFDNNGNKVIAIETGTMGDKVLNARFSVAEYTIQYKGIDGLANNNPEGYSANTPTIILKDITKTGYHFEYWIDEQGHKIEKIEQGSTGDRTITAQFSLITYTITYHWEGGTQVNNPTTYTIESPTIVLKESTKIGYKFIGWYYSVDGGNKVENIQKGTYGNIVLYAHFTPIIYTITYENVEGATNTANPQRYTIEDAIKLETPTKEGYTFQGWYNGNVEVLNISKGSIGDLTLTARWTQNQ